MIKAFVDGVEDKESEFQNWNHAGKFFANNGKYYGAAREVSFRVVDESAAEADGENTPPEDAASTVDKPLTKAQLIELAKSKGVYTADMDKSSYTKAMIQEAIDKAGESGEPSPEITDFDKAAEADGENNV
jgi:hypothetical protein